MSRLAIGTMSLILCLAACEKRKGTLLPSREGGAKEVELRARPPVPEMEGAPKEAEAEKSSPEDVASLEKVKQEALERIRAPGEEIVTKGTKPNARALFERGRELALSGQTSEAQEYYLVACQFGYVAGCHKFGWYEQKTGNLSNARQFYKVACEAGVGKSCNNLGVQLEAEQKWEDAQNFYAKACLEHHSVSCENLKRLRNERLRLR